MAAAVSESFGDLLDPRFQRIFNDEYAQLPDMIPTIFGMPADNGRADMRWSQVGAFADWSEFTGSVEYDTVYQGYDTTATHVEFASGFQVERSLFDDDQYNVMDQRPQGLARALSRTRQKHGARPFNNAFSVDTFFYNNSESVALCSNSHTTNAEGVSTATGFDNLVTTALSNTAVSAARLQHRKIRDDRGNRISSMPNELIVPIDLEDTAREIVGSKGDPESANNTINVNSNRFNVIAWDYLTDTNNWFMSDSSNRKTFLVWIDRVGREFAFAEDLDTIIAKWRGYARYSNAHWDWRWVTGAQVS